MTVFESKRLGESYSAERLPNGLTLLLCPMPGFRTAYAGITAEVGSIDRCFSLDGGPLITLPDGVAHFLEHKLFENADGDAFDKYAKTGANANAFTSFTNTTYLFTCTDHFEENLRILLGFVSDPWFTDGSVAKEQGIIGQEIEMYADDPDWQGFSMLMSALYSAVPLGADIAGSRGSISRITPALLYDCYRAFYSPANLTLTVAGRFDPAAVREICGEFFRTSVSPRVCRPEPEEPREIVRSRITRRMSVSLPQFSIGFKERPLAEGERAFRPVLMEMLLDMLVSDVSSLYRRLYDGGLINDSFSSDVMTFRSHCAVTFSGESRDPEAVFSALCETFDRARREGLDRRAFERSRKAIYARLLKSLANPESAASTVFDFYFAKSNVYDIIEQTAAVQFRDLETLLSEILDGRYAAMSVTLPQDEPEGEN